MRKPRQEKLISYAEYRLREAEDNNENQDDDSYYYSQTDEPDDAYIEHMETPQWGGWQPGEWWQNKGEEDIPVKPTHDAMIQWGAAPPELPSDTEYNIGKPDPDAGYYRIWPEHRTPNDQAKKDLDTLGMQQRPTFVGLPHNGQAMADANGPGPDEDPEDWQAKKDLNEVAGVYGLKLGSTKAGKLVVQGGKLSPWRQDFDDYVSAMQLIKQNAGKVSSR